MLELNQSLSIAVRAQSNFLRTRNLQKSLIEMLDEIIKASKCTGGFITEIFNPRPGGVPLVLTHALRGFQSDQKAHRLAEEIVRQGRMTTFPEMSALYSGLHCIGFPVMEQERVVGCLVLCDRDRFEVKPLSEAIEPILSALSSLIITQEDRLEYDTEVAKQRRREQNLHLVIDEIAEGYWDWNPRDKTIYFSDAWLESFSIDRRQYQTIESARHLVHPDDRRAFYSVMQDHFDGKTYKFELEYRLRCGDGSYVPVLGRAKVIDRDVHGEPLRVIGTTVNMSDYKKVQNQLLSAQKNMVESAKFSALGVMAAGIAHEINNPLAIIQVYSEILEDEARLTPEKLAKARTSIHRSVERISKIIKGLRKVARDGEGDPFEVSSLEVLIDEVISFSGERLAHRGIEFRRDLTPEGLVWCQPVQISQVLLNLMNNSVDAISRQSERWISVRSFKDRGMLIVEFMDSGPGIPPHIQSKVFEPFFTTKQVGQGTGLGLSISRSILEDHGGRFYLDTNRRNTCFVIEIPEVPAEKIMGLQQEFQV